MVNINAVLPSAIAVPFHPATESLHHDNALRPVIPKTEIISSYAKFREGDEHESSLHDQRDFVQDENNQKQQSQDQNRSPEKKRGLFFAKRGKLAEVIDTPIMPNMIGDFKIVMSAIQLRYKNSVTPFASASVQHAI